MRGTRLALVVPFDIDERPLVLESMNLSRLTRLPIDQSQLVSENQVLTNYELDKRSGETPDLDDTSSEACDEDLPELCRFTFVPVGNETVNPAAARILAWDGKSSEELDKIKPVLFNTHE